MKQVDNIYIINLDKDTDRLSSTLQECKKISNNKTPIRIPGVYGKKLQQKIIDNNTTYIYSKFGPKSAIGCAMSHINAWKKIIENNDNSALILEDDVSIDNDFAYKIKNIEIPDDFYIIYLGCTIGCDANKNYDIEYPLAKLFIGNPKKVVKINDNVFIPSLPLALHGYILSKKGAKYLINKLKQDKIYSHIDAQILNYNIPRYAVTPQLIYQKDIDLNTSNNTDNLNYPILVNKALLYKDSNGVPANYKINISIYEYCGYSINGITGLFFIIGILLGISNIKIKYILIGFTIFSLIESSFLMRTNQLKPFIINSTVSILLLFVGYNIGNPIFLMKR